MRRASRDLALSLLLAILLTGADAAAADGPVPGATEPAGSWRWTDDTRPVKAVVIGGSVSAWPRGSFHQFIEAACSRVEVVGRGKARLGSSQLRRRFVRQVLDNRRIDLGAHESAWLIFNGGLNSIGTPERTNQQTADILRRAKDAGMKTLAISVGPWGDDGDRRWRGGGGIFYQEMTRKSVDFLLGRLSVAEAFGRYAGEQTAFAEGELPDIAIDVYDSPLREQEAELRDAERTRRQVTMDKKVRRRLRELPAEERDAALAALVERARELPRWYLRDEYRAFDHIHPNLDGHRAIARVTCPKLPAEWGCDCARIETLTWSREARGLAPTEGVPSAPRGD